MSLSARTQNAFLLCLSFFAALVIAGCSSNFAPSPVAPEKVLIGNIQGSVHGGQAPVTGAWIYLFAAGKTGYGTAATSLISEGTAVCPSSSGFVAPPIASSTYPVLQTACYVRTDNNGNFALGGDYACSTGDVVYMVAVSGNPGMTAGTVNTTATFTANSYAITVASAANIIVGMTVTGTGVGGTVTAVNGTTVTLSQQPSSAGVNVPVSFSVTTTATVLNPITVASATNIGVGMTITGTGVSGTVTAVNGTSITLSQQPTSAGTNVPVTFSAATTARLRTSQNTITVASATNINLGMAVSGTGIGVNTTVTGVAGTTITLSQRPTSGGSNVPVAFSTSTTATFSPVNTITVASASGIVVGMAASGTGIGGTVTAVSGTTVTLSQPPTTSGSNVPVAFSISTTATFTGNSNAITVASASGITVGMTASGTGIGGTVASVSGTTVTLSQQPTSSGTNVPVTFSGVNNTAIIQMAGLATCPSSGNLAAQVPYLVINEVTTVAFGYSMAGFATTPFNVSSDASGVTAMQNALANANNIVNLQWGQAPAAANGNTNSINPQQKIYALANILASCVNTSGANSTQCTNLFKYAVNGTTPATDESSAIFNIAHNQAQNVANIWNLTTSTPVFTPTLSSQPNDWTLPVIYTGLVSQPATTNNKITSGPFNIAFDATGNAWIGDRVNGVVEVGPQGAASNPLHTPTNGMIKGVAIDPVDNTIWASDYNNNAVYVMDSTGSIHQTLKTATNGPTVDGPIMVAFSGNTSALTRAFSANETITGVNVFDSGTYAFQNFQTNNFGNIGTPGWISVDQSGNAWIPSTNSGYTGEVTVTENGNSGTFKYASSESSGSPDSYSTVVDKNNNIWLADINSSDTPEIEEITSGNNSVQAIYGGGGLNAPYKLAVDGGNNVWVCNSAPSGNAPSPATVSAFSISSSNWLAPNGFDTGALTTSNDGKNTPLNPYCVVVAPDPSGNLWVGNSDGSVTQLLGLSTPTAAPMYGGITSTKGTISSGNLGTEP